jgi:hypothetical protein
MLVSVVITVTIAVAIVLVVFISPVAFGVPALGVTVPPPVIASPAVLAGFRKVVTGAVSLRTAIAVVLDRLVKPVVGAVNASLAVIIISTQAGGCAKCGKGREGCCEQCGLAEMLCPSMWQVHLFSLLVRTSLARERRVAGGFELYGDIRRGALGDAVWIWCSIKY